LIAESNYKEMTLDGCKNPAMGQIEAGESLQQLLGKCSDFAEELSALQVLGQELGVLVDFTPKYHTELAGEGIEYT